MNTSKPESRRAIRLLTALVVMALAGSLLSHIVLPVTAEAASFRQPRVLWNNWVASLKARETGPGCFTARFPSVVWHEVACQYQQLPPFSPAQQSPPVGGNGYDYMLAIPDGGISHFEGSFKDIRGLKWAKDQNGKRNEYSLQINTNVWASGVWGPGAWQQFIYSNDLPECYKKGQKVGGCVFMEYWLIDYLKQHASCPFNWKWDNGSSCYSDSPQVQIPQQDITTLSQQRLYGDLAQDDTCNFDYCDQVAFIAPGVGVRIAGFNPLALEAGWDVAEFNVFGNGAAHRDANFNPGTSIGVSFYGTNWGLGTFGCQNAQSYTFEENNLVLGSGCKQKKGLGSFHERN